MWKPHLPVYAFLGASSVLMLCTSMQRPVAAFQPMSRPQWEYKSIIELSQNDIAISETGLLNQAGTVGWELVAVMEGPSPTAKQYLLKRPRHPKD